MNRNRLSAAAFGPAFGIEMATVNPYREGPVKTAWGRVPPGGQTDLHRHDECESLAILSGHGHVTGDAGTEPVGPGDVISVDPFDKHVLVNTGEEELVFVDYYWRDSDAAIRRAETDAAPLKATGRPVFVFSTPPTPNGDLHIGHLSGPYLGADVYTRFQKLNGVEAYHITGSDDYQSYVVGCARQEGRTPEEVAEHYSAEIRETLRMMDIHLDQYTVTRTAEGYMEGARQFLDAVTRSETVALRETPALFDAETGDYLYEVDVSGICPGCGGGCGGNICEECGEPNVCADMGMPVSRLSTLAPETRPLARWTIDLGASELAIRAHQGAARMPARIRALTERVLDKAQAIPVSHPSHWGVAAGGVEDQVFWVWPEMAYGFLYGIEAVGAAREAKGKGAWDKATPSDDWKIVHFFGYDNSFYHAILYPALYAAAHPDWTPDIDYHVNEFYLLEGLKFSTSRRHAIWGKEILTPDTVDAVRMFLSLTRSEVSRTNFSMTAFDTFCTYTLRVGWGGWLRGLGAIVTEDFVGRAPDAGSWSHEQRAFLAELEAHRVAVTRALGADGFSLNVAAKALCDLVEGARRFAAASEHLRGLSAEQDGWRTAVALQLAAARLLAECAAPIMPRFSRRLVTALGLNAVSEWPPAPRLLPVASSVMIGGAEFFPAPKPMPVPTTATAAE